MVHLEKGKTSGCHYTLPLYYHDLSAALGPVKPTDATCNLESFQMLLKFLGLIAAHDGCSEGRCHNFRTDMMILSKSLSHSTIEHTAQSCCLEYPELTY